MILSTWKGSCTRDVAVGPGANIPLPPSSGGEYYVLSEHYERFGKFRLEAAMDGRYAWAEWAAYSLDRESGGGYVLRLAADR